MLPLRDVIPSSSTPYVTITLIAVTSLVWLFELSQPAAEVARLFEAHGVVPAHPHAWSFFTAPFLHASWVHVLGNLWCLWIFGENVEGRMGRVAFGAFIVVSSTAAGAGLVWADPASEIPLVGSGASVAAVLGAYVVLYPGSRILTLVPRVISWDVVELPAAALLGVWFLLQFVDVGALAPTAHAHDPTLAFAGHVLAFVIGAGSMALTGLRRTPAEWWANPSGPR